MSNLTQLSPPVPPADRQRVSRETEEKDADFIALRLLNKRARVRLSPNPVNIEQLPHETRLFAIANSKNCFVAVTRESTAGYSIICSSLSDLRTAFRSSAQEGSEINFVPRTKISLSESPAILTFACRDTRLLVALVNGSITVYDTETLLGGAGGPTPPIHTFTSKSSRTIRQLAANPGDLASLVAVLCQTGGNNETSTVEVLDIQNMKSLGGWQAGHLSGSRPSTLSWSPKGKQIAIGLESGDVVTFSPNATSDVKTMIPKPPTVSGQRVLSTHWLSNTEFYCVFAPHGPMTPEIDQSHYILNNDSKANIFEDIKLSPPYLPFPGLRPPCQRVITLRNWAPARLLLFVGDGTSSDIGLIGSLSDSRSSQPESWYNLSLEETSTPTVPLDKEMNETVLLSLDLDLTNKEPFRYTSPSGEESDVPSPPIMYAYASDGTIAGWHIVNTKGVLYPGMTDIEATGEGPMQTGKLDTAPLTASGSASTSQAIVERGTIPVSPDSSTHEEAMDSDDDDGLGDLTLGDEETAERASDRGPLSMFGSSSLKSSGPGPSNSAFSLPSLSGSSSIKPAAGFGAFANLNTSTGAFANLNTSTNKSFFSSGASPFTTQGGLAKPTFGSPSSVPSPFNTQGGLAKPTFGSPSSGPSPFTTQGGFAKPTFGSPSALGNTKPVFGASAVSPRPPTSFAVGTSGGFAAFSGAPVGFGASTTSGIGTSGGFAAFSGAAVGFGAPPTSGKSFSDLLKEKSNTPELSPDSALASSSKIDNNAKLMSAFAHLVTTSNDLDTDALDDLIQSIAEVSDEETRLQDEEELDDAASFLSSQSSDESGSEHETESPAPTKPEEGVDKQWSTTSVPSSSADKGKSPATFKAPDRAVSTTPPGSPAIVKQSSSSLPSSSLSVSPVPVGTSLGLGRPSTRPARSSPLANEPINGDDSSTENELSASIVTIPENAQLAVKSDSSAQPSSSRFPILKGTTASPTSMPAVAPILPSAGPRGTTASPMSMPVVAPILPSAGPSKLTSPVPPRSQPGATSSATTQAATAEQGIQSECAFLLVTLARELEELRLLARIASEKRENLYQTGAERRTRADLGDASKWAVGDLARLQLIVRSAEEDIVMIARHKDVYIQAIRELESQMLKVSTRKEEIFRFGKASMDADFAKMLKTRMLGPEHLETQSHLRRDLRALRDRIQHLEDHIQAAKKKLRQMKVGKAALRAPSLDTIHRIYRNIDSAIEQQQSDVARLTSRANELNAQTAPRSQNHGMDLRDPASSRRPNPSPDVVLSTAAALNAERSASKLKRALLAVRHAPLLNNQASRASNNTRFAPHVTGHGAAMPTVTREQNMLSPGNSASIYATSSADTSFNLPSPGSHSTHHGSRHRTSSGKYHAKPLPLKRASPSSSAPPSFDWGPLPGVTPMKTLPVDVRKKTPSQLGEPPSLSGSWVTEGFEG